MVFGKRKSWSINRSTMQHESERIFKSFAANTFVTWWWDWKIDRTNIKSELKFSAFSNSSPATHQWVWHFQQRGIIVSCSWNGAEMKTSREMVEKILDLTCQVKLHFWFLNILERRRLRARWIAAQRTFWCREGFALVAMGKIRESMLQLEEIWD